MLVPAMPDDMTGDIAVLKLTRPPPAEEPAPMYRAEGAAGHAFTARGFPPGHDNGVLAHGQIIGHVAAEWLQLEAASSRGFPLTEGFSGAPIWDEELGAVVGVVVARDRVGQARTAYGIPVEVLRGYWSDLPEPQVIVHLELRNPDGEKIGNYPLHTDCWSRTPVVIGRREPGYPPPDLVIEPDPQRWVSREHCRLDLAARRWRLTDTSTNGTFVRRRGMVRLTRVSGSINLQAGDVICIPAPPGTAGDRYWELEFHDPHHTADATAATGHNSNIQED